MGAEEQGVAICPSYPLEIGRLTVTDPSQNVDPGITLSCKAPTAGRLIFIMENPDESRDGFFSIVIPSVDPHTRYLALDTCRHESFVGIYWSYPCIGDKGPARTVLQLNIPSGPIEIRLPYTATQWGRFSGQDNTGPDTLIAYFEPNPISFVDATKLTTFIAGAQEASSYAAVVNGPGQILIDVTQTGTEDNSGSSLFFYLDGAALSATHMRDRDHLQITPHTLAIPLEEARSYEFKIAHEDSRWDDNVGPRSADIYFLSGNQPPTANAGPDQTVNEGDVVTLDGSGCSDLDGDPLSFSWTQTAGPAVTLAGANTPQPTFTAPQVDVGGAVLTFQLTVDDGRGGTSSASVNITVNDSGVGARISITKTVKESSLRPGDIIEYTIVIRNSGGLQGNNPGNEFEDPIPDGTIFLPGSASASSGAISFERGTNKIIWNGSVAAGGSVTLQFHAVRPAPRPDLSTVPLWPTAGIMALGLVLGAGAFRLRRHRAFWAGIFLVLAMFVLNSCGSLPVVICNQGTFHSDSNGDGINDKDVLTNDPNTSAAEDPTCLETGGQ